MASKSRSYDGDEQIDDQQTPRLTVAEAEQVEAGMTKTRPCTEGCGRRAAKFRDGRCLACNTLAGYLYRRVWGHDE